MNGFGEILPSVECSPRINDPGFGGDLVGSGLRLPKSGPRPGSSNV